MLNQTTATAAAIYARVSTEDQAERQTVKWCIRQVYRRMEVAGGGGGVMPVRVRALEPEEAAAVKRLAHSRTQPARLVERARMVWLALTGASAPAIAREVGCSAETVRHWLKRFNRHGVDGLRDAARSGRPPTYTPAQVGEVVATALSNPSTLGLPFACWTLDRLATYLEEVKGIPMKRSRIDELLITEGLCWRTQETWFGERVDPDFAQKRGRSRHSTPSRLRIVS
jgi:transposase